MTTKKAVQKKTKPKTPVKVEIAKPKRSARRTPSETLQHVVLAAHDRLQGIQVSWILPQLNDNGEAVAVKMSFLDGTDFFVWVTTKGTLSAQVVVDASSRKWYLKSRDAFRAEMKAKGVNNQLLI